MSLGDGGTEKSERRTGKAGRMKVMKDTQGKGSKSNVTLTKGEKKITEQNGERKKRNLNFKIDQKS